MIYQTPTGPASQPILMRPAPTAEAGDSPEHSLILVGSCPEGIQRLRAALGDLGAKWGKNVLAKSFCHNLSPTCWTADCALRTSDILITWPVEILFVLISSGSGAVRRAQPAAARYGAGIAILNGGGDGSGKPIQSAAERFMALREAVAANASSVFPDAERPDAERKESVDDRTAVDTPGLR